MDAVWRVAQVGDSDCRWVPLIVSDCFPHQVPRRLQVHPQPRDPRRVLWHVDQPGRGHLEVRATIALDGP